MRLTLPFTSTNISRPMMGQLIKGEGMMSLSRGFIHAGCPSVVMSLWSVDDRSTSDVMYYFYQQLKAGEPKDRALQQAKKLFLQQAKKAEQHPFYWAPFIQCGQTKALTFQSNNSLLGISFLIPLIILFSLFLLWLFRKWR